MQLPLVEVHHNSHGNRSGLIHSELRLYCPNIVVLMDVDDVMFLIVFNVHYEIDGNTPEIVHSEHCLYLIRDQANYALLGMTRRLMTHRMTTAMTRP